jgi:hypothetical protein
MKSKVLFSDYFELSSDTLDNYGALNICLSADLPLFVDPFLLFSSEKEDYKKLHTKIIDHIIYLKQIATSKNERKKIDNFKFKEVKQNWLGWCEHGNEGKGLGKKFAENLIKAFNGFYKNFGEETILEESHIEKLTLVGKGIGRDFISDFTTNLVKEYLLEFTQNFALNHLQPHQRKIFSVKCIFDREFNMWLSKKFTLPYFYLEKNGDFILLTPFDILTKDEAFISSNDLYDSFSHITDALENTFLRESINEYLQKHLPPKNPKQRDWDYAIGKTLHKFPEIIDHYLKYKEDNREDAHAVSEAKRQQLLKELIYNFQKLNELLLEHSNFFRLGYNSYTESFERVKFLKGVIENNDGYRIFYDDGKPIAKEEVIQRIFKLTWYQTPYDVNAEVNNGRGPADYKVSYGAKDSTIIEFKLGRSSSLKDNLEKQAEIYKKASGSHSTLKVILCYNMVEINKVKRIIKGITDSDEIPENIIIIDASIKKSASKVKSSKSTANN